MDIGYILSTRIKILLGRFLTRSGDQAWDFAIPLTLLKIFPNQIRIAAAYFLIVKILHVLIFPRLALLIDHRSRIKIAYTGISMQLIGVLCGSTALYFLNIANSGQNNIEKEIFLFLALGLSGLISSLGSSLMNISIGNDLVPSAIPASEMTQFNSRLRQLDLFTEVTSPVLAGLLLIINYPTVPLLGFYLIALWNIASFVPELLILHAIFKTHPDLLKKKTVTTNSRQQSLIFKLQKGWSSFFHQPIAPAMTAYALLWLSVLSPHGVLLTSYLKDVWKMPEIVIGIFRGLGALFGLVSTFLFPIAVARFGLIKGSKFFILFQTAMLIFALIFFWLPTSVSQYGFLFFLLLSRIGLYGFSLGEMQIRQLGIAAHERGEVNGFADALTGIATLALYGFGTLLPSTAQFSILIIGSVTFVTTGAVIFTFWNPPANFK